MLGHVNLTAGVHAGVDQSVAPGYSATHPAAQPEEAGKPSNHGAGSEAEAKLSYAPGDTDKAASSPAFCSPWWNAVACGGFDLTDVWAVDTAIAVDILQVFALVAGCQHYPDTLSYGERFE